MEAKIVCQICGNDISNKSCSLPCNHQFCQICISRWCTQSKSCPICGCSFTRLKELVNGEFTGFYLSAKALGEIYKKSEDSNFQTENTIKLNNANHFNHNENSEKSTPSPVRTPYRRGLNIQVEIGSPQLALTSLI